MRFSLPTEALATLLVLGLVNGAPGSFAKQEAVPFSGLSRTHEKALEGDAQSQFVLAAAYYDGEGTSQDHEKAVEWWTHAAAQGLSSAQFRLGACLLYGRGIQENNVTAFNLFRSAADQGHLKAQLATAYCYEQGIGVPVDLDEARRRYSSAADAGSSKAKVLLGHFSYFVDEDAAAAVEWLLRAVEDGDSDAFYGLGFIYHYCPDDTVRSEELCKKWYEAAARQGDVRAQLELGYLTQPDQQRHLTSGSRQWLTMAAKQDSAAAQFMLAFRSDMKEDATKWLIVLAERGDVSAQSALGSRFEAGDGVPKDLVAAYCWRSLAAAAGEEHRLDRYFLEQLGDKLTPEAIAEALKMASRVSSKYAANGRISGMGQMAWHSLERSTFWRPSEPWFHKTP